MLKRVILAVSLGLAGFAVHAQDRVTLGWGRLMSNDQIGDSQDRWRTGSYTVSRVRGADWSGHSAAAFGDILELRGHAAVIAPANLTTPSAIDRRYAGVLGFGLYSHFGWRGAEMSLGADMSVTGPQSGIGGFQSWFHGLLGMVEPSNAVLNAQIGNKIIPGINAEIGRSFGEKVQIRPYAEARAGVETLLRVGGDITIGALGRDDLMLRDETTGQRYRAVEGAREQGLSLTMGGDVARVFDSALLADTGAAGLREDRYRLRAGLHWQGEKSSAFYGVSYLSPEFTGQPEGQLVGALGLNLRF